MSGADAVKNNAARSPAAERSAPSLRKITLTIVRLLFTSTPGHCTLDMLLAVVHSLTFTMTVISTQLLFDAIIRAAGGLTDFGGCVVPLLIMSAATFGQQIMNGVHNFHGGMMFEISRGKINLVLYCKLQKIDPARFEDTDFLDDLNKAKESVSAIPWHCMTLFMIVCFYGVYFASVGAYLFWLKPILPVAIALAFVPAMLSQTVRVKVFTKLEEQSAPLRRENEYYKKAICDREYFKETRILGAFKFINRLYSDTLSLLTRKVWLAERKTALLQLALNAVSFAGMAASAWLLFTATMAGEISVGAFAAVFSALGVMFNIMQEIVDRHLGNINKELGKIANFVRMLDEPERSGAEGTHDFKKGVVAENVSFIYPGRDAPAVKNVSIALADGETVAIVGENGAGKSTLVRLLTGVYRPSEGRVTVGGLDTAASSPASVYKNISGVFQNYQRYKMTLGENVSISDTGAAPDAEKIALALASADADAAEALNTRHDDGGTEASNTRRDDGGAREEAPAAPVGQSNGLPHTRPAAGLDTMLSPEFDGVDLSGGQWQRLAIARGLYRASRFIVLDEPTSAIDPIEETRIYAQFKRLAENKCAIVVTHRLGSAKLADRVVVMDGGEIADSGTHEELLSRPGKYADMWTAQAKWYLEDGG